MVGSRKEGRNIIGEVFARPARGNSSMMVEEEAMHNGTHHTTHCCVLSC